MQKPLKIMIVSSEVAPFAKTGGLADVAGALPKKLKELGHDVRVFLPYYDRIKKSGIETHTAVERMNVKITDREESCSILKSKMGSEVPVYFLKKERYFGRPNLYGTPNGDYEDNAERFIFFSRAALELAKAIEFRADIYHCNDWQTGIVPLYLKSHYKDDAFFARTKSVFTIHNLAFQGCFWHFDMHLTGLTWDYFSPEKIEFFGKISLLKAGLVYADKLNTVSKKYAKEIQTPEHGCGMEGILQKRKKDLYGILNGIDYDVFNPATDRDVVSRYSVEDMSGKAECKAELQKVSNIPQKPHVPIIGIVSRLTNQKGFDLIADAIEDMMSRDIQLVILGTGVEKYHVLLREIAKKYPEKTGFFIKYDVELAPKIYSGSDIFLMPSKFEPCGLGQLISMRYGTVPVVRKTGGLADTVSGFNAKTGEGNGFVFQKYSSESMLRSIQKAVNCYKDKRSWKRLVKTCMESDFSWNKSAAQYLSMYKKALGG